MGADQVVINPGAHRGTPRPTCLPVIDSPEAAGQALGELFLANADRGDDAANDDLVAELVRRIRAQQDSRDGDRDQQPPSQPTGCRPTPQLPAPQFGNSPDSGRPPVEQFLRPIPAPGGRPDTTTPVDSASLAADVDRVDHPSGGREQPRLGRRRGVVIDRCVALPVTSVKPTTSPSRELVRALVLQRAHDGGVVKLGADYLDHGSPTPGSLAGVFDELADTGLLTLAEPDSEGPRRVSLTTAGHARYEQLRGTPRPSGLRVPAPQFPTRTAGRKRLSGPGPLAPPAVSEPDAGCAAGESSVGPLRWARCPDGRLHLLQPADVVVAATGGQAEALCGRSLPAEGLTLTHGSAEALCLTCLAGTGPREERPQPEAPGPRNPRPATGGDLRTAAAPIGDQPARRG